jgi:hypothetical protein
VSYTLATTFRELQGMPLPLLVTLQEHYEDGHGEVNSKARYDHYRRFETGARLLP